jgi:hypothetical protein
MRILLIILVLTLNYCKITQQQLTASTPEPTPTIADYDTLDLTVNNVRIVIEFLDIKYTDMVLKQSI